MSHVVAPVHGTRYQTTQHQHQHPSRFRALSVGPALAFALSSSYLLSFGLTSELGIGSEMNGVAKRRVDLSSGSVRFAFGLKHLHV